MSRTSIIAILACAGIVFTGEITQEAVAFARVVQSADPMLLQRYAQQNPQSQFAPMAIQAAANCIANWVNGGCSPSDVVPNESSHTQPIKPPVKYT